MATPIAHKGVIVGAKVQAMTILDILASRTGEAGLGLFQERSDQRCEVQEFSSTRRQARHLVESENYGRIQARMKAFYYDPSKYDTYLEQLGIKYPTVH